MQSQPQVAPTTAPSESSADAGRSAEEAFSAERHAYHTLRVARVTDETHDTRSFELEIPSSLADVYAYQAGQFLTFRVSYQGQELTRCYSMSSSPDTDGAPVVTVKRVAEGRISNWFNDELSEGDELAVLPPSGRFVLQPRDTPLLLFAGGSGVTPMFSIIKTALTCSQRTVRLVYANRDRRSIIFQRELTALQEKYPERLSVTHSLDAEHGFLTAARVRELAAGHLESDVYVCGPGAFMDIVENTIAELGVPRERFFIERFVSPPDPEAQKAAAEAAKAETAGSDIPSELTVHWDGKVHLVPYERGETLLAAAIRAGIDPPYSCEEAYCSSCQAVLRKGTVHQAMNDCLSDHELGEGLCLPCQAYPTSPEIELDWDA